MKIKNEKLSDALYATTMSMLGIIVLGGFISSYMSIQELVEKTLKFSKTWSYFLPICVDAAIFGGALAALNQEVKGHKTIYAKYVVVGVVTIISVVLNLLHAPESEILKLKISIPWTSWAMSVSQLVAIVPPLIMFLIIELGLIVTREHLEGKDRSLTRKKRATSKKKVPASRKRTRKKHSTAARKNREQRVQALKEENPDLSYPEIAKIEGCSSKTIARVFEDKAS